MQRALGIFVAGIVLGMLIVYALTPAARKDNSVAVPNSSVPGNNSKVSGNEPSAPKLTAEGEKIILGNIATVPFQELYAVLSVRSPEEMTLLAQQLNELPPGRETKAKINTFFKAWAQLDAKAALAAAVSLKTVEAKSTAIGAVLGGADAATSGSLATVINKLPADAISPTQKTRFLNTALSKWSEIDPVAAAKFLDSIPSSGGGFFGSRITIAQNWASTDPAAALAWVQGQGDTQDAKFAMSGVISGWWENDPRAAEAYVASHLDSIGMDAVMRITTQLFQRDPQGAKDWASRLSTPEARRSADTYIAMQMADVDPKGASEWAATLADDVRSRALSGAISKWSRNDARAVEQWINNLNGTVRDEAITAYSSTMAYNNPAAGLNWATTVSDATARTAAVERIVGGWMRRSPNDAKAWIQSSTLTEPEKAKLLSLPVRR
ncbi:MAG: hypothetical protein DLM73_16375 [Chthoniobacterales bacterium]|nr:MAG: hypothetical protein DLM73_16375 [Chthoniobacterales bacterium]